MMLVLEVAAGIVLAVILLAFWQEILTIGVVGVAAIVGAVAVISVLNAIVPFRVIAHWFGIVMPWVVLAGMFVAAVGYLYGCLTGKLKVSDEDALEWAEKSTYDKWVQRAANASAAFIVGGGALTWALSAIGVLK